MHEAPFNPPMVPWNAATRAEAPRVCERASRPRRSQAGAGLLAGLALFSLALGGACETGPEAESTAGAKAGAATGDRATSTPRPSSNRRPDPGASRSEGRALSSDELADLEAMCAAVDKDYVDGTLSDYFAALSTRSPWGEALRSEAEDSVTPGRSLARAARARDLEISAAGTPHCARLFDYLDEVE